MRMHGIAYRTAVQRMNEIAVTPALVIQYKNRNEEKKYGQINEKEQAKQIALQRLHTHTHTHTAFSAKYGVYCVNNEQFCINWHN